jgi:hypothetical protein
LALWIQIRIWIRIETNADPKHCFFFILKIE